MEQPALQMVETANNPGIVTLKEGVVEAPCLTRSSVADGQEETIASIESAARPVPNVRLFHPTWIPGVSAPIPTSWLLCKPRIRISYAGAQFR
jgi:hypothetical protein